MMMSIVPAVSLCQGAETHALNRVHSAQIGYRHRKMPLPSDMDAQREVETHGEDFRRKSPSDNRPCTILILSPTAAVNIVAAMKERTQTSVDIDEMQLLTFFPCSPAECIPRFFLGCH